jgi:hypothetical protein
MALPCPMCGSWEAIWEELAPASRGFLKALLRPFEVFTGSSESRSRFGLTGDQRTQPIRASGRRFIKKWSCPVCGRSGEQTA